MHVLTAEEAHLPRHARVVTELSAAGTIPGYGVGMAWSTLPGQPAPIHIHHEASPGAFVHVVLGLSGVLIYSDENAVMVSLADLVKLARTMVPALGATALQEVIGNVVPLPPAPPSLSPSPPSGGGEGRGEGATHQPKV